MTQPGMALPTDTVASVTSGRQSRRSRTPRPAGRASKVLMYVVLGIGAFAFLFPFYYMVVGSLQTTVDPSVAGAFPSPGNLTFQNYVAINERINLFQGLLNSGIFTGGVLIGTIVFGVLAGYALAILHWRGRGVVFALALLVQVVPFQLLMIPLYVMIARDFGLADSYGGMILPFFINSTAVIIFRQYFVQLPKELWEAARIDGASELRVLWNVALPLVRPAVLTTIILTFIGPWNEFLWPFLITKEAALQPLAVSLANFISNIAASVANPFGAMMAGAVVLSIPAIVLFLFFQRYFVSTDLGSSVKG